ncbi:MAG TPA: alpha-glucan family phosphorylase [Candidatus Limnocylindrales bacterium]|nr:alpha-glucan family phosphorylase [Candidatus Limnocylindrales bacterium]
MEPLINVPTLISIPLRVPPPLEGLRRLAYNLWWSWHPSAKALFARVDGSAWQRYKNPIEVLAGSPDWSALVNDPDFRAEYETIIAEFDAYVANGRDHWFHRAHAADLPGPIAYFCAEYGIHESLGIYSGGLGILAGDHMKTASDMALPLIGVGLMYRKGYFRQTIDADGQQQHAYPDFDLTRLPVLRVADQNGDPLQVTVELPGRDLAVGVWCVKVGRVSVLLLDTDVPDNLDSDRPISHILYVRGREMRLHQELVLGVGGVRAIRALGIDPAVWHLNEGHSAFLLAERVRELVTTGTPLDEAWDRVRRNAVFTIHTPVSAGNERFEAGLVRRVAGPLFDGDDRPRTGGVPIEDIIERGVGVDGDDSQFDMTAFSLRSTNDANAVSQLHGTTANATWGAITSRPIGGITNGVHVATWTGGPMRELFEDQLDADLDDLDARDGPRRFWERVSRLSDDELWEAHQRQKLELAIFARGRLRVQFARHGEAPSVLAELEESIDPDVVTVGFARRFATYKRSGLLFHDLDRLERLVRDADRPLQIVFAGKAHPADRPGQGAIAEIFARSRGDGLRGRVFIIEDYDIRVARFLVQGVDVWLNTPRRPLEASGTSGMKAAVNGVPNLSVLDGWWDEGYGGENGWAIGGRDDAEDEATQDARDAADLYRLLEEEVMPRYYERDGSGLPVGWIAVMRRAIQSAIWQFSSTRMLHEYTEYLYLPAAGIAAPDESPHEEAVPVTEL